VVNWGETQRDKQTVDRRRRLARISPIGNDSRRSACVFEYSKTGRNGHVREEWGRARQRRSGAGTRFVRALQQNGKDGSVGEKQHRLEKD
jgi:hypothetical protein